MICKCASKLLILVSRITLPKEINAILDRFRKKFFDCNLFCDGDTQELTLVTHRNMIILQILSLKPNLYDEWFANYDVMR